MKVTELILEIFGWLIIVFGTTIAIGLLALLLYVNWPDETGKLIAIILALLGFCFGGIWATKIWKKQGIVVWLSGIRRIT